MHAALLVLVPACVVLCVWQVRRALSGNELSWAYVFEWPFFAAYGVYVWWKLVHDQPRARSAASPTPLADRPAPADDEDEELVAYNRYLADLHARGPQKRW
jgi:hypothetical protein